jgi:hypothetical protein
VQFSSEYQPENRGRKPGSLNKANALIRDAVPAIVEKVIAKALEGDTTAANMLLARAVPPLKAMNAPLYLESIPENPGKFAKLLVQSMMENNDPQMVTNALKSIMAASEIYEASALEERICALEALVR